MQASQPFAAFADHGMRAEHVDALDEHAGAVRQPVIPLRQLAGIVAYAGDPEVRRIVVRHDPEVTVSVLHVVLDAGASGGNQARPGCGSCGIDDMRFALREAARGDGNEAAAAQPAHAGVEQHIGFVKHIHVLPYRGADRVSPDAICALRRVRGHVEQRPAVAGPREPEAKPLLAITQVRARTQVLDAEREILVARGVDEQGEQRMIRADLESAKAEERSPTRLAVLVEDHLFRCVEPFQPATEDGIRLALHSARVVEKRCIPRRHAQVRLPDARHQLRVERLLQRLRGCSQRIRVGVLRVQIRSDARIVEIPEPGVVIDDGLAVERRFVRMPCRDWRGRVCIGRCVCHGAGKGWAWPRRAEPRECARAMDTVCAGDGSSRTSGVRATHDLMRPSGGLADRGASCVPRTVSRWAQAPPRVQWPSRRRWSGPGFARTGGTLSHGPVSCRYLAFMDASTSTTPQPHHR